MLYNAIGITTLTPLKLLLLDEHTSALDPLTVNNIMELTAKILKRDKITCILTTHDLNIAQKYGNQVISLKNGKLYKKFNKNEHIHTSVSQMLDSCY